jgi:putative peptidoglycan lipid II flippase
VGVLGLAIATVVYPLLARHAARGKRQNLGVELSRGLRLAWFTALPASVGVMLVARPATSLLFERGAFTAHDTERAAGMIVCYAVGIVAYCAIPLLVRGHYAAGNHAAPARIAVATVACDLLLNLSLVWPCGERGLAISTALAATLQVVLLLAAFAGTVGNLAWRELYVTAIKSSTAVAGMTVVVLACRFGLVTGADASRTQQAVGLTLTITLGAAAYLAVSRMLGMSEVALLLTGGGRAAPRSKPLPARS